MPVSLQPIVVVSEKLVISVGLTLTAKIYSTKYMLYAKLLTIIFLQAKFDDFKHRVEAGSDQCGSLQTETGTTEVNFVVGFVNYCLVS